jgi:hypothetical protein
MKNRIVVTDTKFHIIDHRIVVCELKCSMQMLKHPAWMVINDYMWSKRFPHINYNGEFIVKAKAKCNSIDTFDERKGKMIAKSRAKVKMFNIAYRVWRECCKSLLDYNEKCLSAMMACEIAEDIESKHVEKLLI